MFDWLRRGKKEDGRADEQRLICLRAQFRATQSCRRNTAGLGEAKALSASELQELVDHGMLSQAEADHYAPRGGYVRIDLDTSTAVWDVSHTFAVDPAGMAWPAREVTTMGDAVRVFTSTNPTFWRMCR